MEFDSAEWREKRNVLLRKWFCGNEDAVRLVITLGQIAETWDDLIDGDPVSKEDIHTAFMYALFVLPENPVWAAHRARLAPVLLAGVNAWMDSLTLEHREDTHSKVWAYALRDWYMEVVPAVACCIGGFELMRVVSLPAREFFQAETFEDYMKETQP
jgi:hypothetical protein